jgi:cobalt/nickel transport system permease protein
LIDIIALLRRLKAPEVLLDIMVLCYRTLFVFSEAVHDTITAQSARLGYATVRLSMRSLGGLVANITVQVWQRSQALHLAAMARNNDGPLRFLEHAYPNTARDICVALSTGTVLVALSVVIS